MSEIEIGEYVRSKFGEIKRVDKIFYNKKTNCIEEYGQIIEKSKEAESYTVVDAREVVKHSKNIKELIEQDDIVVYQIKGLEHSTHIDIVREYKDIRTLKNKLRIANYSLEQINIKQILTKGQFNQNCYEVEE